MRVIETAGFYCPDSTGGTETYVSALAKCLQAQDVECSVAAPHASERAIRYVHEGVDVFRYPVPRRWRRCEVQGREPPRGFDIFEDWLRRQHADVYHQHSWTTGCGLWHLKSAKRLGLKTVVTVHVPGNICMRGTMLYEGRAACDGKLVPEKCASCWLQWKGLSRRAALRVARLPQPFGSLEWLPRLGPVLAARALAADRAQQLHEMITVADRIVAVCDWLHDALTTNGVPSRQLVLNRQGVEAPKFETSSRADKPSDVLRLGFLGRWDPIKGAHVLLEAFKLVPLHLPVTLDICATAQGNAGEKYRDHVQRAGRGDPRIRVLPPISHAEVPAFLSGLDAIVVPSQWLETGPLVVLEAFAAGTPVLGSDLGGIRELVSHGSNGLLVPHDDVSSWTAAMVRLATDGGLHRRLRNGIGRVRTMSEVGADMVALYRELMAVRYAS
jgi:glycosyltransferase involved in cell wall biosynthesis